MFSPSSRVRRRFQDLIPWQRAVGADCDGAEPVVRILEKEAAQPRPDAVVKARADCNHERDFGNDEKNAAVAMMGSASSPHLDVEKMLLPALAGSGDPPVTGAWLVFVRLLSHFLGGLAASESSMMRLQSCG